MNDATERPTDRRSVGRCAMASTFGFRAGKRDSARNPYRRPTDSQPRGHATDGSAMIPYAFARWPALTRSGRSDRTAATARVPRQARLLERSRLARRRSNEVGDVVTSSARRSRVARGCPTKHFHNAVSWRGRWIADRVHINALSRSIRSSRTPSGSWDCRQVMSRVTLHRR